MADEPVNSSGSTSSLEEGYEPASGPMRRLQAFSVERFAKPRPKVQDDVVSDAPIVPESIAPRPKSATDHTSRKTINDMLPEDYLVERVNSFRKRQVSGDRKLQQDEFQVEIARAPAPPPANNWIPLGPSIVRRGQVSNQTGVAGRISRIAVAPSGSRVYVASANGGVWRSDNGGESWVSTMEAWDLDPRHTAVISLSCGAIAIDPADSNRVYVGTGEGDNTVADNAGNITWVGSFLGYGPIRSDNGGETWIQEDATPSLNSHAFYALVVDPADREHVIGATTNGLYRRELYAESYRWRRVHNGVITSVVVAHSNGISHFFAARQGGAILYSTNGINWDDSVFANFPSADAGRIGLAVQPNNPHCVYALVAHPYIGYQHPDNYRILGVWRLDNATTASSSWRPVANVPNDVLGDAHHGQGSYDLAICVDPHNENTIYLGGSTRSSGLSTADRWSAAIYRCSVQSSGADANVTYSMTHTPIGANVHADVHDLVFTPSNSNNLWACCDGGVFFCDDAQTGATFNHRNIGLQTQTMEHLGQHPTEGALLFCGTQDDGTVRYAGGSDWLHMAPGDGGYAVVNWADPYRILVTYPETIVRRFDDGGTRYSYTDVSLSTNDSALFYSPMVGAPMNISVPEEAERVAIGTTRPWISDTFGGSWYSIPNNSAADHLGPVTNTKDFRIRSMDFAAHNSLYVGTMNGRVYRYVETVTGSNWTWSRTRLDNLGGAHTLPSAFSLPVTDITVDRNDPTGNSIYVCFGGQASDYRRVWHFNGIEWGQRSGPNASSSRSLLDVQFNALITDPDYPNHVYAGADIGVWCSFDGGLNWTPMQEGLPDASVFDLKIVRLDSGLRVLRAATHGRGVYERTLDNVRKQGVDLYIRATQLDQGRFPAVLGRPDPTRKGSTIDAKRSPDIKLDTPDSSGNYQLPDGGVNFYQFTDKLEDKYLFVSTHETQTIINRIYVQVHNRGVIPAENVRLVCLLARASCGLPQLPPNYSENLRNGDEISGGGWQMLGTVTLNDIRVSLPRIAVFELPSTLLPRPSQLIGQTDFGLLVLAHHANDPYDSIIVDAEQNSIRDRKTALKHINIKQINGALTTRPNAIS